MSRKWTLPTLMLFLCSGGALQANPLDSPGVVYIDGLPCNRACQSYMGWSERALSARHREQRETEAALPPPATLEIAAPPAKSEVAALPATAAAAPALASRTIRQQVVEATGI